MPLAGITTKRKKCGECQYMLPRTQFTSTRAKHCRNCLVVRKLTQERERQQRAYDRLKLRKQKTVKVVRLSDYKKLVQRQFNAWIRKRDEKCGCISCGNKNASSYDAGHFWAMGSNSALRFHPDNCHKQCGSCNRFKHGNQGEYRIGLVKKIGLKRVKYLEDHRRDVKRWTREELDEVIRSLT